MSAKPVIFVSAVSRELKSARQLVADTLIYLGYEPDWKDVFGAEQGDLRAMLRRRIDASAGIVQIVGRAYGAEPPAPDDTFGRVSYTQYEALHARQQGKKVWYLLLDDAFPADPCDPEPEEKTRLQRDYREKLRVGTDLYHPIQSRDALEATALKLRPDLDELRREWEEEQRRARRFRVFAGIGLGLLFVIGITGLRFGWWVKKDAIVTKQTVLRVERKVDALPLAVAEAIQRTVAEAAAGGGRDDATRRTLLFADLEKKHGLPAGTLAAELPEMARKRADDAAIPKIDRAEAAFAALDYTEAERLALEAAGEARKAVPLNKHKLIEALELAGLSASSSRDDRAALSHFTDASKLTDKTAHPLEWAHVYHSLASALDDRGDPAPAANLLTEVVAIRTDKLGAKHPDNLRSRNNLALALGAQGKNAEAEQERRSVLKVRVRVLGAEHPDTLKSRNNLALVLGAQGKNAEAEQEHRGVLNVMERVLGAEHPDVAASCYNLALCLEAQKKLPEALAFMQRAEQIATKALGPDHPKTKGVKEGRERIEAKLKR